MNQRINNTIVTPKLYDEFVRRRNLGAKMFLAIPVRTILDDIISQGGSYCANCDGAGKIALQIIVSGPHDEPQKRFEEYAGSDGKEQRNNLGCIWHKGKWFNVKTILDDCACCQGSGKVAPRRQPAREAVPA